MLTAPTPLTVLSRSVITPKPSYSMKISSEAKVLSKIITECLEVPNRSLDMKVEPQRGRTQIESGNVTEPEIRAKPCSSVLSFCSLSAFMRNIPGSETSKENPYPRRYSRLLM